MVPPTRPRPNASRARGIVLGLVAAAVTIPAAWALHQSRPYRVWSANRALNQGQADRAIERLGPWKTSDDTEAVTLVARAQVARGNPESAVRLLETRLTQRVEPKWLTLLGETLLDLGALGPALETFEALDALQPEHPPTLSRIAELSEPLRGPAAADRRYQQLEQLEPTNPAWPKRRGLILLGTDRYALAAASLHAALVLDPEDGEARLWLAEALYLSGDPEAGLKQLDLCRGGPPDARVQLARAECLRALGRSDDAIALLDQRLSQMPDDADALRLRGELDLEAGELDQALAWLNRALAHAPGDWRVHYQLSLVLARLGRTEEARRHADRMETERERARFAPGP